MFWPFFYVFKLINFILSRQGACVPKLLFEIVAVEEEEVGGDVLAVVECGIVLGSDGEGMVVVVGVLAEGAFLLLEVTPVTHGFVEGEEAVDSEYLG